jgi:hypothetical protein
MNAGTSFARSSPIVLAGAKFKDGEPVADDETTTTVERVAA